MERNWIFAIMLIGFLIQPLGLNGQTDIWVTNNMDTGFGSLRWAIEQASNSTNQNVIKFNITASNKTINLSSPIWITKPNIIVDGTTQVDQGFVKIDLSQLQSNGDWAFVANANNIEVKNLWFCNFQTTYTTTLGAWNATNTKFHNNYFTNCRVALGAGGNSDQITFDSNKVGFTPFLEYKGFSNNELGLWAGSSTNLVVKNNIITNVFDSPIVIDGCENVSIFNNFLGTGIDGSFGNGNINSDTTGIWIGGSNTISLQDNKISASTNSGWGVSVSYSSNIFIEAGNEIEGCNVGVALNNVTDFTLSESSLVCNLTPLLFQNQMNTTDAPIIQYALSNIVSGHSQPYAKIEVYESNVWECVCQGENFLGTTQSNSIGEWELNTNLEGIDKVVALSTSNNLTSAYSECVSVEHNSVCPEPVIIGYDFGMFGAMVDWEVDNYTYDDDNFEDSYSFEWREKGTINWKIGGTYWGQHGGYDEEESILGECYIGECYVTFDFPPPPTSIYLNSLKPNTEYDIRVKLNCFNGGSSEYSDILSIKTPIPIPNDYLNKNYYSASRGNFITTSESLIINNIDVRKEECERNKCIGCDTGFSLLNSGYTNVADKVLLQNGVNELMLSILPDTFSSEFQNIVYIDTVALELFCSMWIDYDQDQIFDESEKVFESMEFNPLQNLAASFSVNSFSGKRKMRLIYQHGNPPEAYGYYCTGHTYDMDVELTNVFCNDPIEDILCQDWIRIIYESIQTQNPGECVDIVLYEDVCQIEFLLNGEACGLSSYYIDGEATGYCNTSGNYTVIHSCDIIFSNCGNCELEPDFTIAYKNFPIDNSLERLYQLSNIATTAYDSIVWWSSSEGWFGANENTPIFSIWPKAYEQEEEICLQISKNENGIWCDSLICKTIIIPCTNYSYLDVDVDEYEVHLNIGCDCTSNVFIDYGDGINFDSSDQGLIEGYNQYANPGFYNICLYMYDEICADTLCQEIEIISSITEYDLTVNKLCVDKNEELQFEYTAIPLGQKAEIHFGDGFVQDIGQVSGIISHTYENAGAYSARLVVDDETKDTERIQVKSCGWYGFVYSNNHYREDDEEMCAFITGDGRAYISPQLSDISYYWTAYRNIQEFNVCGDEVILEARIKVPQTEGGISCYDPDIHIYGTTGTGQAHFMTTGCQYYAYIRAAETLNHRSNTDLDDLIPLTGNFENWVNLKIRLSESEIEAFYDNELRYTMEYEGEIGQVLGIGFSAKGSGSIDWIRLSEINETIVYEENFSDCTLNQDEECVEYVFNCDESVNTFELADPEISILIYPNPTTNLIRVSSSDFRIQRKDITIYNSLGQNAHAEVVENSSYCTVNFNGLPKGVYFVALKINSHKYLNKVVVL